MPARSVRTSVSELLTSTVFEEQAMDFKDNDNHTIDLILLCSAVLMAFDLPVSN